MSAVKLVAAIVFFIFVVLIIYPWRMESRKIWSDNDLDALVSREDFLARRAVKQTEKLPEDDERRLMATQQLADCYWQENKLDAADQLLSRLWVIRDKMGKGQYDQRFVDVMLMTAGVHRDQGKIDIAQKNYEQVYWYDTHHQDADTPKRIARDLNNLGVAYYMVGLSKESQSDGLSDYKRSIDYLDEAIKRDRELYGSDSQYEAPTL